jgi:hypothetical protein
MITLKISHAAALRLYARLTETPGTMCEVEDALFEAILAKMDKIGDDGRAFNDFTPVSELPALNDEEISLCRSAMAGETTARIQAIKSYRNRLTGMTLKQAKEKTDLFMQIIAEQGLENARVAESQLWHRQND